MIADVDGDGTAEIVTGGWDDLELLHVFKWKSTPWRRSRPVWNQHSYFITNINGDGSVPSPQAINWLTPGLNNFRVNIPLPEERSGQDIDIFTYYANDGELDSNTATVTIDILPPNTAPAILSQPPTKAAAGLEYFYAVRAVDPDAGEVLTFTLPQGPPGLTMGADTGLIRWIPEIAQAGAHLVVAKVTDSQGEFAFQGFTVQVVAALTVPDVVGEVQAAAETAIVAAGFTVGTITNSPSNTVPAGQVISQEPVAGALAPQGSPIHLVISSGVQTVNVPNVVSQTKTAAIATLNGAGLTVGTVRTAMSDTVPAGSVISQDPSAGISVPLGSAVHLVISTGNISLENLTSIVVEPSAPLILMGQNQSFSATGIFHDGTSLNITDFTLWSSSIPPVATVSTTGIASGLSPGSTIISASINDITGNTLLTVAAQTPGDTTPPTAQITAPDHNSAITGPANMIGTAVDANFLKYVLEFAPAGQTSFTIIGTGTSPVTNGILGSFDPTLLLNDLYTIRLTVFDKGGNEASATVVVQVEGDRKVGLFSLTFTDLKVPVPGLPIAVNRVYDSRDKKVGDFGVGWRLDVQTMRIRTNRTLGTGWVRQQSGAVINLVATDEHRVSVLLPDGKVEVFDMQVSPTSGFGGLDATNVIGYSPRPGTLGTLEALANNSLLILNAGLEDELVDDETLNTYDPQLYRYTSADGTKFEIHRVQGVTKITDRNGNVLSFGANGISHSAGKGVSFIRDGLGRIHQIYDPAGNLHQYAYNANGDLISYTNPVGESSQYTYNASHGLLSVKDAAGNLRGRNEYDERGRLIATIDALGNRLELTHDIGASVEVVRDRLGNITVLAYDESGNLIGKTDALGQTTSYTYDSQGNQLTQTDPLGRTASWMYDARRNVLTSTDFEGNTVTLTYNSRNQILTLTDTEGRTTTNAYDSNGNLIQVTDPEAGVTHHTYDPAGNRLTTTDPLGNMTAYTYDSFGNVTSETDPLGNVTSFAYDASGNVLSEAKAGIQTALFRYDAAQRLTESIDALGKRTVTTYSAVGSGLNAATETDANGNVTYFEYDPRGNLISKTFPDGSSEITTYDAENRIVTRTDRDGRTTTFECDVLGRQVKTVNPDGTAMTTVYDAANRILSRTDERGNTMTHSYAPNKQVVTDPFGNVTVHEFDSRQRRIQTTDALGRSTRFDYDSKGNLKETTFPNGSTVTKTYDLMGHMISETDPAGNQTHIAYDAAGRPVQVTDAAGGITTYAYDSFGNRITQTDANGNVSVMEYDLTGRIIKRTRPLGQFETFTYDANGNRTSHTDFNGQTTFFTYDSSNRMTAKILPGGGIVSFAYTPAGLRTQAWGDSYVYDSRGRLTKETKAGGDVLSYTYDLAGNRTSVTTAFGTTTYAYDSLNRLATVSDSGGTTTYSYDAVGNLASTAYPNGVTATYGYDTLNRLVQMTNAGAGGLLSSYLYTLGAAGNRVQVVETGPATTGRIVSYTYDPVYRLTQENIDEPGVANDQIITYTYDAVGNRLQMNRNASITAYGYDANDRLLTEVSAVRTLTSTYDNNGNLKTVSDGINTDLYTYDAENRLSTAVVQTGASPATIGFTYDADGMRTTRTVNGTTTAFLVDKNRVFQESANPCGCAGDDMETVPQVLAETTGTTVVTYTYGYDLIRQTGSASGTRFYQYDGQLSVRHLTDPTGAVTDTYTYDAFGVLIGSSGTTPNVYLYVGEQLDPNIGFYYLRARYYSPSQGRFTTTDPELGSVFDPVSLHRYLYARANPVTNWDPTGRENLAQILFTNALRVSLAVSALNFAGTYLISKDLGLAAGTSFGVFIVTYTTILTFGEAAVAESFVHGLLRSIHLGEVGAVNVVLAKFLEKVFMSKRVRCKAIEKMIDMVLALDDIPMGPSAMGTPTNTRLVSLSSETKFAKRTLLDRLGQELVQWGCK